MYGWAYPFGILAAVEVRLVIRRHGRSISG